MHKIQQKTWIKGGRSKGDFEPCITINVTIAANVGWRSWRVEEERGLRSKSLKGWGCMHGLWVGGDMILLDRGVAYNRCWVHIWWDSEGSGAGVAWWCWIWMEVEVEVIGHFRLLSCTIFFIWKILAKPQILSFLLKILLVYRFLNQMGQNVQIKKDGTKHFKFLLTYFFGWACQILLFPIVQ